VLNTDAEIYGGSGVGNFGVVEAEQRVWHGRPASAVLQLPPSGVLWLAPPEGIPRSVPADASDAAAQDAHASAEPGQRPPTGSVTPAADVAAEPEGEDSSTHR
jgi:1,4-alpha-glucan branching enzyme